MESSGIPVNLVIQALRERSFCPRYTALERARKRSNGAAKVNAKAASDAAPKPKRKRVITRQRASNATDTLIRVALKLVEERKKLADPDEIGPTFDETTYRNTAMNSFHEEDVKNNETIALRVERLKARDKEVVDALMFQEAMDTVIETYRP